MTETHIINGFSKLSRSEKLVWLQKQAELSQHTLKMMDRHIHPDPELQEIYGELSENTISNFYLPLGLAPNFMINGRLMTIPMVIEESSVVAAASHAAKFWAMNNGFKAEVRGMQKVGQIHFSWSGSKEDLFRAFNLQQQELLHSANSITRRMVERGGGVDALELKSTSIKLPQDYQLFITFHTADAMGANFINSVLEKISLQLSTMMTKSGVEGELTIIMSILSNYTPECMVHCHVEGKTRIFEGLDPRLSGDQFAEKFKKAVDIAIHDRYRAVTHNKGIFNGMDAVIMATGNDFRAIEACGHAFASRHGSYESLSWVELSESSFRFSLEVPLALGTVGGLTRTHPMALASLDILGHPSSEGLMQIVAAAGLANNFSAVRSLITTGIQKGQSLHKIRSENRSVFNWNARYGNQLWFSATFDSSSLGILDASNMETAETLKKLLLACGELAPFYLQELCIWDVETRLDFSPDWGFGSSSTLTALIADWAEVNPLDLHFMISEGSGYDVACAIAEGPIVYRIRDHGPNYQHVSFSPPFSDHLYFVWLGSKQATAAHLARMTGRIEPDKETIHQFSSLTNNMIEARDLSTFQELMEEHEKRLSSLLKMKRISLTRFQGLPGTVKSLGAWGGDFVLIASETDEKELFDYLYEKGLKVIFKFNDLVYNEC